jgi:hypothetical protein
MEIQSDRAIPFLYVLIIMKETTLATKSTGTPHTLAGISTSNLTIRR